MTHENTPKKKYATCDKQKESLQHSRKTGAHSFSKSSFRQRSAASYYVLALSGKKKSLALGFFFLAYLQVAIVGNEVGGARSVVLDLSAGGGSQVLDQAGDLHGGSDALETHEVGSETGNVGRGYETVC
jgi:hypothetical protein